VKKSYTVILTTPLILDDETFFLAKNGTSMNVSTVKYLVAKYVKKAGIRKKVSVHTLRHTFGAHKADKHMSLATLQELMGHKKKETTLKYIHLAKTNLRQEMVQTAL
jgi:integrase/recombinase XerD